MTEQRPSTNEHARQAWCGRVTGGLGNRGNWRVMLQLADGNLANCKSPVFNFDGSMDPYFQVLEWMFDNIHPDHNPVIVWSQSFGVQEFNALFGDK